MMTMHEMLKKMLDNNASDIHLTAGSNPLYRVDGKLVPMHSERLAPDEVLKLSYSIMNEAQRKNFEQNKEVDFSFGVQNLARFRANVFLQRGCCACAIRQIPYIIRPVDELGLPPVVSKLTERPNGLVLVTGPTGSGKSTTLAAIVDKINTEREGHILTVEDPIEFIHKHKRCIINQREVHQDTNSFSSALRVALRQDPDVVLIGEMRDLETIQAALSIAETGHLTLATLHTNSAAQTVNRIIDVFPADQKATVRAQLSMVLEGIISQALIPRIGGGRTMACEIMIATMAVRSLIRDDKTHQLQGIMEIGQKFGMQTMNSELIKLYQRRLITKRDALGKSPDPEQLIKILGEE
ncbi:type IV pilus twitching motility protein PilT [Chitinispirillales bacterium ANBcel5]|uniref:type IV pilus twitching motility protein PilT n=1 Tax=Cellulosispirillum alkaliphilum TaxID=3039283 RepID=UPI002A569F84|nr:type IV pilus twitching motility protein PilT [Chitinispirillales bacterium ANBcel5]